jgi:predicted DNA-binding transcriptional regulator AlpA|tara:strand:- start:182 stop:403 length:222 start_codon:yes stop_codon:yes gene_type:complete
MSNTPQYFFSINEFCKAASMSRGFFYKICKAGKGPNLYKEEEGQRSKVFIPADEAQEWFEQNKMNLVEYTYDH